MGKIPTNSLGKSSELKLHCFCLFDAYSMPKDIYSAAQIGNKVNYKYFPFPKYPDMYQYEQIDLECKKLACNLFSSKHS